jgi:uncharacterized protein
MNQRRRKKLQRRLLLAAQFGSAQQVAAALRSGADLSEDGGAGFSAVQWARAGGHHETLRLLQAAAA